MNVFGDINFCRPKWKFLIIMDLQNEADDDWSVLKHGYV